MKEFENNAFFWQKVDSLFLSGTKTLMKKKGEHHDTYNNLVYPVDYSRIVDMKSPSAHGVAVYMGSGNRNSVTGLIVAADILEKELDVNFTNKFNIEVHQNLGTFEIYDQYYD